MRPPTSAEAAAAPATPAAAAEEWKRVLLGVLGLLLLLLLLRPPLTAAAAAAEVETVNGEGADGLDDCFTFGGIRTPLECDEWDWEVVAPAEGPDDEVLSANRARLVCAPEVSGLRNEASASGGHRLGEIDAKVATLGKKSRAEDDLQPCCSGYRLAIAPTARVEEDAVSCTTRGSKTPPLRAGTFPSPRLSNVVIGAPLSTPSAPHSTASSDGIATNSSSSSSSGDATALIAGCVATERAAGGGCDRVLRENYSAVRKCRQ